MAEREGEKLLPRCPRCERHDVLQSRRRWYDLPAVALRLRPYRCARCGRRFYRAKEPRN